MDYKNNINLSGIKMMQAKNGGINSYSEFIILIESSHLFYLALSFGNNFENNR